MADELDVFFFPFVGGGHQIPMIDIARLFAFHGVKSTVIATPASAPSFQSSITRDHLSGRPISVHTLDLPLDSELPNSDMSAPGSTDTSVLREPLRLLLTEHPPDCIVVDTFHRWSADLIDELGVPRIIFNGNGCFSRCAQDKIRIHKPDEQVESEFDPFEVPGLPHRIVLTQSQLPQFHKFPGGAKKPPGGGRMFGFDERSFGTVVNSFLDLEPDYVAYFKKELAKKAWVIGPVSMCNRNVEDKAERGQKAAIDEHSCLNWLNSKVADSVLYISFGSLVKMSPEQIVEIAHGLESSGCSFVWAVGKILEMSDNGGGGGGGIQREDLLPAGFEERMRESKKGLIIRGWAPQLLILEHPSVGGFMTHCGWNSTLEGASAGVPMATFPRSAEQFFNEKLVTDVLRTGVQVGSLQWTSWHTGPGEIVGREKVDAAARKLMDGGENAAEMRRRAKELGEKAKRAVEPGGSSYADVVALIQELKSHKKDLKR